MKFRKRWPFAAATIAWCLGNWTAGAQTSFVQRPADAVLRSVLVHGGFVYFAAYDRNEVWKVDPSGGDVIAQIPVPKGPVALAGDGDVIACVCRNAKRVALIRPGENSAYAEVETGNEPVDLTALPGGGFAVANSFSDSVTLIDPESPHTPAELANVSSVPSAVAASSSYLAVATRSPAAILLYTGGSQTPDARIQLDAAPSGIYAISGDRFIVISKVGAHVVDAAARRIAHTRKGDIRDVTTMGDDIILLTAEGAEICNAALDVRSTIELAADARSVCAMPGLVVAVSPKAKSWYVASGVAFAEASTAPTTTRADQSPPPATAVSALESRELRTDNVANDDAALPESNRAQSDEAPVIKDAISVQAMPPVDANPQPTEPSDQADPVTAVESNAAPAIVRANPSNSNGEDVRPTEPEVEADKSPDTATAIPTPEPVAAAAAESVEEAGPTSETAAGQSEKENDTAAKKPRKREQKVPRASSWSSRTSRIRPGFVPGQVPPGEEPMPSDRPSVSPFAAPSPQPTFGEIVTGGIEAGTQDTGFQPPDWRQPFRNVRADSGQEFPDGSIIADGNVYLRIDTLEFAADHFEYDKATGKVFVSGNVEIIQGPSTAFADEVTYIVPLGAQLESPPPLIAAEGDTEQDLAKKLMSLGSLDAKNIEIIEPARRLRADHVVYDFQTQTGTAYGVEGEAGQIRFGGDEFRTVGEGEIEGLGLWLTTCDCDHEYYRVLLREATIKGGGVTARNAQLELGRVNTPIYWPRWTIGGAESPTVGIEFESGRKAELGYYVNVAQRFAVTPELQLGVRLLPTTKEGIGFGIDGYYNYMDSPASPLFRGKGEFHTLYTTKDRGYYEWFHRQELTPDTVMLVQMEQWSDRDFYKDFYYERYKDRTQPRNFVNVTHTQPTYIASATVRKTTNDFVSETERMPEVTFHLLERELAPRLYFTFDTITGYNEREPSSENAVRTINVARLSYDIELGQALNLVPFTELEASWYSKGRKEDDSDGRLASELGLTLQSRFQKSYPGFWGFSSFKHIVVPSVTYSYRPESSMDVENTPRFDAYDNVYGRSRIESKIDQIFYGRDADTGESWQVARLSLYQGNDFWNEIRKSDDIEIEIDIRPRAYWGFQTIAERHSISKDEDIDLDDPFIVQRGLIELYERVLDRPFDPETADKYNTRYGDYDRLLTFFYYDDRDFSGRFHGRVGYAYTKTQDQIFNREILYGLGYKINEKWSVAFEHRYDLERGELYRQKYEVRRVMNCLEGALLINERESGWDFGVEFSVTGIPGTRIRF